MSLAQRNLVATLALTAAFAANANAAQPTTVELNQLDLSKPVPNNVCFETNNKGTAFDKLKTAMNARNQIVVATANQAVVALDGGSPLAGKILSSAANGSEGYYIGFETPKEKISTSPSACLVSIKNISIYNVYTLKAVPPEVNKGELGKGLRNAHDNGLKVMMTAQSNGGALLAVSYSPSKGIGSLDSADVNGNKAATLGNMASISYTTKAKELLGITDAQTTPAPAPSAPR